MTLTMSGTILVPDASECHRLAPKSSKMYRCAVPWLFLLWKGDGTCRSTGLGGNTQVAGGYISSADLENYWAHWKYNLDDSGCEWP